MGDAMGYSEKLIVKLALEMIPEPPKEIRASTEESKLIYRIFQNSQAVIPDFLKEIVRRITLNTINGIETDEKFRADVVSVLLKLKAEMANYGNQK